ncbi:MAG: hypothetical protein HYY55_03540 [Candidatus Niyogibacteria bacterium]|nr:MAG: hypothetical protein HYY55_03540 [Candidatus Niyogibacteria bacterium]
MNLDEIRKVFKENELRHYSIFPKERIIVFTFDNDHTLSVEIDGHPGINYEWDERAIVKVDGELIAST